jgi:hypothetical protein
MDGRCVGVLARLVIEQPSYKHGPCAPLLIDRGPTLEYLLFVPYVVVDEDRPCGRSRS